jgi:type IV secretion system protein VirB11
MSAALSRLACSGVVTVPRALIAETIDVIAVLAGRDADRPPDALAQLRGLTATGECNLTPAGDSS